MCENTLIISHKLLPLLQISKRKKKKKIIRINETITTCEKTQNAIPKQTTLNQKVAYEQKHTYNTNSE